MKKCILALSVLALAAGCALAAPRGKALVAVFSKIGEQYNVGVIQEGNTMIVAKMIAAAAGADLFEIRTVKAYPEGYDETTDVAKKNCARACAPNWRRTKISAPTTPSFSVIRSGGAKCPWPCSPSSNPTTGRAKP